MNYTKTSRLDPHRRLIYAVVLQAVRDITSKKCSRADKETAVTFLKENIDAIAAMARVRQTTITQYINQKK